MQVKGSKGKHHRRLQTLQRRVVLSLLFRAQPTPLFQSTGPSGALCKGQETRQQARVERKHFSSNISSLCLMFGIRTQKVSTLSIPTPNHRHHHPLKEGTPPPNALLTIAFLDLYPTRMALQRKNPDPMLLLTHRTNASTANHQKRGAPPAMKPPTTMNMTPLITRRKNPDVIWQVFFL